MENNTKSDSAPPELSEAQKALERQRWEILYGGVDQPIIRIVDGKIDETSVKVRKIPIAEMGKLAHAFGRMDQELRLYLGVEQTFVDSMADDSKIVCMQQGRRLNSKSFAAWFGLQTEAAEVMTGKAFDAQKIIKEATAKALAGDNAA